jgi:hypothetical protein
MAVINPYNGVFGALLVEREATDQAAVTLTKADAIPVFQQTMAIDLQFATEDIMLEDPEGTGYLSQIVGAKCTWAFEAPLYGIGAVETSVGSGLYNITVPRFLTAILSTAFDITTTNGVANPTLALVPSINHSNALCSFAMRGIFAITGSPAGSGNMLNAELIGCKIGKATISIKADGIHRIKLEGGGVYNGDWDDTAEDLAGHNWDATAQEFVRGMGQGFSMQVNGSGTVYAANLTTADISIDFGAEHIVSDGALSTLGVAGVAVTKRDITISIDPVWVLASSYSIFAVARAGGWFAMSSNFAYPSAYSTGVAAKGHGIKFDLPKVQFANTTPQRGGVTRAKLDGVARKNIESDDPLTITIGSV